MEKRWKVSLSPKTATICHLDLVILSGATTALGRKQDMKESVDSATATGGDVTATPPALAAVDFDVDRRPGCFCTALHTMRMLVLRRTEKRKENVESN